MSQTDQNVANAAGATVRSDINDHLEAIQTQNSSAVAPTTTFQFQRWMDSGALIHKARNAADGAWINVLKFTASTVTPYMNGILLAIPSQAEAEAGSATSERIWTAQRVKQAILALGTAGAVATVGQAEAEAGSATTRRIWTAQRVKQAILALTTFSPDFSATGETVTNDTLLEVAHGLGAIPSLVKVSLVNVTGELGYSTGDEITGSEFSYGLRDRGISILIDATNISIIQGLGIAVLDKSTFNDASVAVAKWTWTVRVWT